MTERRKVGTACFVISGEYITNHFREIAWQGEWRVALRQLMADMEGMTEEQANQLLKGDMKLVGDNEFDFVEEDEEVKAEWDERYNEYYGRFLYKDNKFYKPHTQMLDVSYANGWAHEKGLRKIILEPVAPNSLFGKHTCNDAQPAALANFWVIDEGLLWTWCHTPKTYPTLVGWVECSECPPYWVDEKTKPQDVLEMYLTSEIRQLTGDDIRLENISYEVECMLGRNTSKCSNKTNVVVHKAKLVDNKKQNEWNVNQKAMEDADERRYQRDLLQAKAWGIKVLEQNGDDFVDILGYKVPRKPLASWALRRTGYGHLASWKTVSEEGFKMPNDDPDHTDWVAGTVGLATLEFYTKHQDVNNAAFEWKFEFENSINKGNLSTLVPCRMSELSGDVSWPKHDSVVTTDIVVIPDCTAKWMAVAVQVGVRGGIIIAAQGGQMSHLCMNGEEYGITLMYNPKALELFPTGQRINVDPRNNTYQHIKQDFMYGGY